MSISSPGIGSGLDVNSIVTQLVELERRPIAALQEKKTKLNTQLSSIGLVQSYMANVQSAAGVIAKAEFWTSRVATSADPTLFEAKITGSGSVAGHSLRPTALAAAQANSSVGFTTADSVVGTGSLTISIGTWTGTSSFSPKAGTTAVTVTLGAGDNTLERIRDRINEANAGVNASIVFDGTNHRLTLTSKETGVANGFRITAVDSDGSHTNGSGLSRLTYDPPGGTSRLTRNVTAADATATLNGLSVSSPSNTFDRALPGVSFTIKNTSTTAVGLDVRINSDALKKGINDFVSAFNEISKYLSTQTRYDDATKVAGPLQGDRSAVGLLNQLRSTLQQTSTASTVYTRLGDLGLELQRDGSIKINSAKLDAAVADPAELSRAFTTLQTGFGQRFKALGDSVLGTEGLLTTRTNGLRDSISRNDKDQKRLEERVARVQERLTRQYSALDGSLNRLNGLGSYVQQQITNWNKTDNRL